MSNSLKRMRGHKRLQSRVGRALKIERDVYTGAFVVMISELERMSEINTRARLRLKLCENEETNRRALDLDKYSSLQPCRWTILDLTLLLKADSARLFRIPLWMYSNNQHRGSVKEVLWLFCKRYVAHYPPLVYRFLLSFNRVRSELSAKAANFQTVDLLFVFTHALQCFQFYGKTMTIPSWLIFHTTSNWSYYIRNWYPVSNLWRLIISFRIYLYRIGKTLYTLFSKCLLL